MASPLIRFCVIQQSTAQFEKRQIVGRTMIITESTWVHPAKYQAESGFLIGAYQSLSGIDAYCGFMQVLEWDLDPRRAFWQVKPGPREMR